MKTSDLIAKISGGLAKSNRFLVFLSPPQLISSALGGFSGSMSNSNLQNILLLCDSAQLPGLNVNTVQNRTFGEVREIPYEFNYEPITLTFYVDADMNVKKLFDAWINSIQIDETRKFNYYDSYTCPMKIYVQDMAEKNRYIVEMMEVYPKTVSAVQLDFANRDVMKLQVTMMYKYWRSYQVAYTFGSDAVKYDTFDYTTNVQTDQYFNNFTDFQQDYNDTYGSPENFLNYTGNTLTYI